MAGDVVVRVLDGEDTIGGSKVLVGWGGEGVFLDFGINYAHYGRYFEEYVKPRTSSGLGDLWRLGLVPQVAGLYRPDVLPPDLKTAGSELPVKSITGVYLSHAHLDHAGLIGLLHPEIPLICSRTTAAILKSSQDSGKADLFAQSIYHSPLRGNKNVGGQTVLAADKTKPFQGRACYFTDGAGNGGFEAFWRFHPTTLEGAAPGKKPRVKGFVPGDLLRAQPSSGGVHVRSAVVDHSVLGSNAFVLETPQGPIVYSGDVRAHGQHAADTRAFLESLVRRPPWILLMEGTQVRERRPEESAYGLPTGEDEVEANCLDVVERHRGELVVADFAARNIERLQAFLRIARRTQRRLVILPRDAYLLHGMHAADPSVPTAADGMGIFDPPAATEGKWEGWVLDQYASQIVSPAELRRAPQDYILCLSFWDVKHLLDLAPEKGAYVYSSSEAHSEEQAIDLQRLHNWLAHFGLKPYGFHAVPSRHGGAKPDIVPDPGFHASGHMPGDEILDWIERIRPEHLLPIHTEGRSHFEKRFAGSGIKFLSGGIG